MGVQGKHLEEKPFDFTMMLLFEVCSYPTVSWVSWVQLFCSPRDCSLPGSSVHGISLAGILEWVATSFSRGSSQSRDGTIVSCAGRWILHC